MFDMTPFKTKDGAVLELDKEEAKEFAEFYNCLPYANGEFKERRQCVRICYEDNEFWRFYGTKDAYERSGCNILHLSDIRINCNDLGEITPSDICIRDLFL